MPDTARQLKEALFKIIKSGEPNALSKMSYGGVLIDTRDGPRLATLTLTLKKPPRIPSGKNGR